MIIPTDIFNYGTERYIQFDTSKSVVQAYVIL